MDFVYAVSYNFRKLFLTNQVGNDLGQELPSEHFMYISYRLQFQLLKNLHECMFLRVSSSEAPDSRDDFFLFFFFCHQTFINSSALPVSLMAVKPVHEDRNLLLSLYCSTATQNVAVLQAKYFH